MIEPKTNKQNLALWEYRSLIIPTSDEFKHSTSNFQNAFKIFYFMYFLKYYGKIINGEKEANNNNIL